MEPLALAVEILVPITKLVDCVCHEGFPYFRSMDQVVHIPVEYRGVEREFEARVQVWRYGHRWFVQVEDVELVFEQDDAGEYRALMPEGYAGKLPDRDLVQAIAGVLDALETL